MSRYSISRRSPGFAPFTYTGPVSGCATVRSSFSRSCAVVRGPICRSLASRVSSVTSSPGAASITGAMSGCQRLCPLRGSSRRRLARSMLMLLAMVAGIIAPRQAGAVAVVCRGLSRGRRAMRNLALIALSMLVAAEAAAQAYPAKPPRLLVGFVPGGGVDQTARITTAKLTEIWGQPITVENKPGAGGTIAGDSVAKAAPDGYTFVLCNIGSHGVSPALYKKIPYDAIRDVTYIGLIGTTPNVMAVHPSVSARTVGEVIGYAPGQPRQINYRSL